MSTVTLLFVVLAIAANVAASLLLKKFAVTTARVQLDLSWNCVAQLIVPFAALTFYAVAFAAYAVVLRSLPVSKAYTLITFGAQLALIVAGAFFFGERLNTLGLIGLMLVLSGLIVVAASMAES